MSLVRNEAQFSATAYTHMKPYPRLNSFIKGVLYRLDYDIKETETELKMWNEAEVKIIMGEDAGECLVAAQTRLQELNTEKLKWLARAEKLHYCTNCNGCGEYWERVAQDESKRRQCLVCKGTGINPETVADAPPVPAPTKKKSLTGILAGLGRKFR